MRLLQVDYETIDGVGYMICYAVDLPGDERHRYAVLPVSEVQAAFPHHTSVDLPFHGQLYTNEERTQGKHRVDIRHPPSTS